MTTKKVNPLMEQEKMKAEMDKLVKQAQGIEEDEADAFYDGRRCCYSQEDVATVKKMAIDRNTSVSGLLHEWIMATMD